MWLIFTILTVIFWGVSETIFKKSTKGDEHSVAHLLAYNGIFFGIVGITYMLVVYKGFGFDFRNVLKYFPIAATYLLAMFSYYHAMKRVKISLVSPIVNTSCILTVVLCILVLHQYPSPSQAVAIVLVIAGLILLSINKTPEDDSEEDTRVKPKINIYILGLIFAFGYFVLDGLASFLDAAFLEGYMQDCDMIISHSIISLALGIGCYIYLKIKDKSYRIEIDKYKAIGSVFETAGEFTYIFAFVNGSASVISPFVATYSVVTIILSRIFLKEKLKIRQYLLIVLILIGVVFLSIE